MARPAEEIGVSAPGAEEEPCLSPSHKPENFGSLFLIPQRRLNPQLVPRRDEAADVVTEQPNGRAALVAVRRRPGLPVTAGVAREGSVCNRLPVAAPESARTDQSDVMFLSTIEMQKAMAEGRPVVDPARKTARRSKDLSLLLRVVGHPQKRSWTGGTHHPCGAPA